MCLGGSEVSILFLMSLALDMNRLLTGLGGLPKFKRSWAAQILVDY